MKNNLGKVDHIIKIVIILAIGALYFTGRDSCAAAISLEIMAIVLLVTRIGCYCPVYSILKTSTRRTMNGFHKE